MLDLDIFLQAVMIKEKIMSMINQEAIASIMNVINDAINDLGYVAVGYENTRMSLNIIIEPNNLVEEENDKT